MIGEIVAAHMSKLEEQEEYIKALKKGLRYEQKENKQLKELLYQIIKFCNDKGIY